ncbi:MAG: ribonuclease HII [Bacteroidetes bacterium]|nr:ribonuclease HII [Bacteroidota bacterium]
MSKLLPYFQKNQIEAGCDEAGRGCLAGPVVASAVILNPKKKIIGLNDSKKLTEKNRIFLQEEIKEKALAWAIGECSPQEIDDFNILRCSFLAMHRALDQLPKKFTSILVDGNRFTPYPNVDHYTFIKGDGRFQSIAAASILAKCHRDETMQKLSADFPAYQWQQNKGYPTKTHRAAIAKNGPTEHHRMSFQLLAIEQLSLF